MAFPSSAAIVEHASAGGLTHVSVGCVDWNGRLRTKQLHTRHLTKALHDGTALTSAIFATDGAEVPIDGSYFQDPQNGYRDAWLTLAPPGAFRDPLNDGTGLILIGQLHGAHAQFCPRAILARECAALTALGFVPFSAFEIECHVLQESIGALQHKVPSDLISHPDFQRMYSFVDQAAQAPLLSALRVATEATGIPLDSLHIEFKGLLEAALVPALGLAAADRVTLYKALVKAIARRHGALAVFMAQLSEIHEAAGGHLNVSLRDLANDRPIFYDAAQPDRLSQVCRWFLGGLQRYAPELFILFAPNINSFKRFGARSFVPTTNSWAIDNKTVAFRAVNTQPNLTRIEIRIAGADINPYLALAAALAAGRHGIEHQINPSEVAHGDALRSASASGAPFPDTFDAAIARWRESEFTQATFGREFVDAFAQSRRWQTAQLARIVTDWEVRQFAECV